MASIAHPGRLTVTGTERENLLVDMVNWGADGIEAVYTTHTDEETAYFQGFAKKHGLWITGGSDTHFDGKTHRVGMPRFIPSDELLARILK